MQLIFFTTENSMLCTVALLSQEMYVRVYIGQHDSLVAAQQFCVIGKVSRGGHQFHLQCIAKTIVPTFDTCD